MREYGARFEPAGFGLAFSTTLFSQLFQHSVPGLVRPLADADRPKAMWLSRKQPMDAERD